MLNDVGNAMNNVCMLYGNLPVGRYLWPGKGWGRLTLDLIGQQDSASVARSVPKRFPSMNS